MQVFQIAINEQQRQFISEALSKHVALKKQLHLRLPASVDAGELEELDMLEGMFKDLPQMQKDDPELILGLCY